MQHVRYNPHPIPKIFIGFARFTWMISEGSEGVRTPGPPASYATGSVHWVRAEPGRQIILERFT